MVSLEDAIVARYAHGERRFEILVDPEKAMELRSGKSVPTEDLLASAEIFKDARKGDRAGEKELKEAFGTTDVQKIAEEIVKKGTIQLTTEQKRRAMEEKKRQIVSYIARIAINPQTNAPHTPQRIEKAMEEARVSIDPFKSVEEQVTKIIDAIRYKIPIKVENVMLEITLSPQEYGRCSQLLKEYGRFRDQGWLPDGKFRCVLEVPAGVKGEFMNLLVRRAGDGVSIKEQERGKR